MKIEQLDDTPEQFPRELTGFFLDGPVGRLELISDWPEEHDQPIGIAVLCHPHSLHGGTMHNKVVTIMERSLRELGMATLRFNFRGVGESGGEFDDGEGESDDLCRVVEWMREKLPGLPLCLAGFSFGAYVAARNASDLRPFQLITIAPPVQRFDFDEIERPDCPWLVVQGDEDEVVEAEAVHSWAESVEPEVTLLRMDDTGHFFHRRLMDLRGLIKNAVKRNLPGNE